MQDKILRFLNSLLGDGHRTSGENHAYYCPVCNHRKRKLEVDISRGWWHCWVCDKGSKNIFGLLKWIKAPAEKFIELKRIMGRPNQIQSVNNTHSSRGTLELPKEFIPLWDINAESFYWNAAIKYLYSRGIYATDILKYGIGYCVTGNYAQMLIIPSYDVDGNLNYFSTRIFLDNKETKFKNPPVSKDIVGFEMFINWDEPIILVESPLDAITVRHNAIPLFGKTIQDNLRLTMLSNDVQCIVLCLDSDAMANAVNQAEIFVGCGIDVRVVSLPDGEDPSSVGHKKVWEYINNAPSMNDGGLLEFIIKDHLYGEGKTNLPRRRHTCIKTE